MRIVHAVTHYDLLTGSGLYVYELARSLKARGHDVAVVAENIGGELTSRTRALGIDVKSAQAPPQTSVDLLHVHQPDIGMRCMSHWTRSRVVATLHSQWPGDAPIMSDRVATYICVRPEVRKKVIDVDGLPPGRTAVVLNGVDRARFRPRPAPPPRERPLVLFAATMSPMREPAARHLISRAGAEDLDVLFVGIGPGEYLRDLPAHARWEQREVWAIEDYVADCNQVAGTFMGRTAIEGWMCQKPVWVYDVDPFTGEAPLAIHPPPPAPFLDLCDIDYMTDVIERIYREALRS